MSMNEHISIGRVNSERGGDRMDIEGYTAGHKLKRLPADKASLTLDIDLIPGRH